MKKEIYAAIFVRSDTMSLKFAEANFDIDEPQNICVVSFNSNRKTVVPPEFKLTPYDNGHFDKKVRFRRETIETNIQELITAIDKTPIKVDCLVISSYGPILSVNKSDRDAKDNPKRQANYGRISESSVHEKLAGINLYKHFRNQLDASGKDIEIIVQTDVVCGGIHESYTREYPPINRRELSKDDLLVFINIAEGIGGSIVKNLAPFHRTIHPEFGFLTGQILADDGYGKVIVPQSGRNQVSAFYELLASSKALLARSKERELRDVSKEDWNISARYIAQLCASILFVIGPNQFVLHGDFLDDARYPDGTKIDFVNMVRRDLMTWLNSSRGQYIHYEDLRHDSFIDSSIRLEWPNHRKEEERISPMHHGAFILAARRNIG